jgi:hypothetical protein
MSHQESRSSRGHLRKRIFAKDCKFFIHFFNTMLTCLVRLMMYGFGDVPNPDHDTVNVLEEMVIDYISDMVSR